MGTETNLKYVVVMNLKSDDRYLYALGGAVLGVTLGEDFADALLGILVGQCDGCLVGLALDFNIRPVVWEDFFGGLFAKVGNKFDEFVFLSACKF